MAEYPDTPLFFMSRDMDRLFDRLLEEMTGHEEAIPVITGPTATGKSSMALRLALALGGEIISCDAMQVYRGFDIGTAKATKEDQEKVRHHMLDILDPCQAITVASYVKEASRLIRDLLDRGIRPVICGGSVQYISALLDGLDFAHVSPDPELREELTRKIRQRGLEASWEQVRDLDPQAAEKIAPTDLRRISRFFELYQQTGLTKTELNQRSRMKGPDFDFKGFWLDWTPREKLYQAIHDRLDRMWEEGLIDEVEGLMQAYPDYADCPAFRGIGYRETVSLLEGLLDEKEARESVARSTRRYAKRQQTWLRGRKDLFRLLYQAP